MTQPSLIILGGPPDSGKTTAAERIVDNAAKKQLRAIVYDHEVYSFHLSYRADLDKVKQRAASCKADIAIIVIGAGAEDNAWISTDKVMAKRLWKLMTAKDPT